MARLIKDVAREDAAMVLRRYWNGLFPVDPIVIAKQLNVRVFEATMPEGVSGQIVREEGSPAQIF